MMRLISSQKQFIVWPIQLKINQYRSMVYTGPAWQKLLRQGPLFSVDRSGEFTLTFICSSADKTKIEENVERKWALSFSPMSFFCPFIVVTSHPRLLYDSENNPRLLNTQTPSHPKVQKSTFFEISQKVPIWKIQKSSSSNI